MATLRPLARPLLAIALTVGLVGCTGTAASSTPATDRAPSPLETPMPTTPADPHGLPADLEAAIRADAATALGVAVDQVQIVSADAVTWNDGSLGCPKPGVMYIQMVIPGYHVIVAANDRQLDYRTGRNGDIKRCEGFRPGGSSG